MKKISFVFILLLSTSAAFSQTLLLSDIDDTIKESHVLSATDKIFRAAQTDLSSQGMSLLYQTLAQENASLGIAYISNAPQIPMLAFHELFLSRNNYPQSEHLFLREGLDDFHKLRTIYGILDSEKPRDVILVGDNGEQDIEIYEKIVATYPQIHFYVFIRTVYSQSEGGQIAHAGQVQFVSSGDLAFQFSQIGQLSAVSAKKIIDLNTKRSLNIFKSAGSALNFPSYVHCEEYQMPSSLKNSADVSVQRLVTVIEDRCQK